MNLVRAIRPLFQAVGWIVADLIPARTPRVPVWGMSEDRLAPQEFRSVYALELGGEALEPGAYQPFDRDAYMAGLKWPEPKLPNPCVVDDCGFQWHTYEELNAHSRQMHVEPNPYFDGGFRYPGSDHVGDFMWHRFVPDRRDQVEHVAEIIFGTGVDTVRALDAARRIVDMLAADKRIAERLDGAQ
jgi:hypothetical protein